MNNILTFEDYKKMNIRQVESVIYRQFIDNTFKEDEEVNEGFIRKAINKASSKFIQNALGEEIEKGKELERSIKEALDGLSEGVGEIEKAVAAEKNTSTDPDSKMARIEKIKEAIKAVQSQTFDTLTLIGSEGEIDFAGFMGSASVAAAAYFGILFSPIRSIFMTRKAYKYFLTIIKQTIRRNLLVIQLNFDQFENLILQKSYETEDNDAITRRETIQEVFNKMEESLFGPNGKGDIIKGKTNIENLKKYMDSYSKYQKDYAKNNPFNSLWQDQHNNTYTRTLEQIKQYINEDSQKEMDALKNGITKMAGGDAELTAYGELLISAAEEYAIKTNYGINNNFIKMSSVFNLENQKNLIELLTKAHEESKAEAEKKSAKLKEDVKDIGEEIESEVEEGEEICKKKLVDSTETYTLEELEEILGEHYEAVRAYFMSTKGKDVYKKIITKNPTYKYYIGDIESLSDLLSSINSLTIVEVSEPKNFYDKIVHEDQALYYMMAEQSIKDAIKSRDSEEYFGFKGIKKNDENILDVGKKKKEEILNSIVKNKTVSVEKGEKTEVPDTRYFLTFNGDGDKLFRLLHREFKTRIVKKDQYVNNISVKNKEILMQLIHKYLNIGSGLTTKFAEYLVRMEAHMLLDKKEPWFVIENNKELFDLNCFKTSTRKIPNKTAFVEINQEDFEDVKSFLTKYHELSKNDFADVEIVEKKKSSKKTTKKKK